MSQVFENVCGYKCVLDYVMPNLPRLFRRSISVQKRKHNAEAQRRSDRHCARMGKIDDNDDVLLVFGWKGAA